MSPELVLQRLALLRRFGDLPSALRDPLFGPLVRAYMKDRARREAARRGHRKDDHRMQIIGLTGSAGAGKDTVAQLLQERRVGVARAAFADALKLEASIAFGVDVRLFHDPAIKATPTRALAADRCVDFDFVDFLGTLRLLQELTPRTIMQQWGDYRRQRDVDYWVRAFERAVGCARWMRSTALVVTDVRYPNEVAWLRRHGGALWRVHRPGLAPVNAHSSEWALRNEPVDLVLANDDSLELLAKRATDAYDDLLARART